MRERGSVLEAARVLDIYSIQSQTISSISAAALVYSALMNHGIVAACKGIVYEMLNDFDGRERSILDRRIVAIEKRATLQELANEFEITRERTRQIEELVIARVKKRAASRHNTILMRAVQQISEGMGTVCPKEYAFTDELADEHQDAKIGPSLILKLIVWLAGPFEEYGEWLVRTPAREYLEGAKKIVRRLARKGPANIEDVISSARRIGIHRPWCLKWVSEVNDVRIFGDKMVWWGGNLADKAYLLLTISGSAMLIDDIYDEVGTEHSRRTLSNYLHMDHKRFRKVGPDRFSIASWGGQKYTSVRAFVLKQIQQHRGTIRKNLLVDTTRFGLGVPKSTVVSVLASPVFIHSSSGYIRVRNDADPVPSTQDINITKHCYRLLVRTDSARRKGCWSYRMKVTSETLRGSGAATSQVFGLQLGMRPGMQVRVESPFGKVSLSWSMPQPLIGSLQKPARALNATIGDRLFLIAVGLKKLQFRLVKAADIERKQGLERLCLEVCGIVCSSRQECVDSVAFSLGFDGEVRGIAGKIRRRLEIRRERELIELISKDDVEAGSNDLDSLIDYVSGV